jgi:hypothetical protein
MHKSADRDEFWALYQARLVEEQHVNPMIELGTADEGGVQAFAIEADWHDLPRVRKMLQSDIELVTEAVASKWPDLEGSAYVLAKEAIKKLMPQEYALLKELKEIILDRNTLKNL